MALPEVFTFTDAFDDLLDFATAQGVSAPAAAISRCVRGAYRELAAAHPWSFLLGNSRVQLQAAQTLTAAYLHTTGAYDRELTATADFPAWIEDAAVRIDGAVCDVESSKAARVVTLDSVMNPGADVASGSIKVYPRWYALPPEFGRLFNPLAKTAWRLGEYIPFSDMAALDAYRDTDGDVRWYTIGPAQDRHGQMALYLHPPSDKTEPLSLPNRRQPRQLRYSGYQTAEYAGTVQSAAGTTDVTGTGTSFAFGPAVSPMVGSILRISANSSRPTGLEGTNPWQEQRVITSVTNGTALTIDASVSTNCLTARGYVISDPIDLDAVAWEAFLRCCEKHYAVARPLIKNKAEIVAIYRDALFQAKGADSRVGQRRICGVPSVYVSRLSESTDRPELS